MTSIIIRIMALHLFCSLSMISCISLSTVWWMWSRSVSYHLSKESRWTLEFSWSNEKDLNATKCWKVWKQLNNHFPIETTCNRSNIILNRCLNVLNMISEPSNCFSAPCKTISLTDNSKLFSPYLLLLIIIILFYCELVVHITDTRAQKVTSYTGCP